MLLLATSLDQPPPSPHCPTRIARPALPNPVCPINPVWPINPVCPISETQAELPEHR